MVQFFVKYMTKFTANKPAFAKKKLLKVYGLLDLGPAPTHTDVLENHATNQLIKYKSV